MVVGISSGKGRERERVGRGSGEGKGRERERVGKGKGSGEGRERERVGRGRVGLGGIMEGGQRQEKAEPREGNR